MAGTLPLLGQESPAVSTTPPTSSAKAEDKSSVTITADGENSYVGQIATADNNVVVRSNGDVIFADHIILDRSTRIVTATGNVRIFSNNRVYRGDSVIYNLDTKAMTSSSFLGGEYPKFLSAKQVTTPGFNHYRLTNASFTTNNREHPSFHMEASTIEYRPNDEVVLKNVILYAGDCPVFYFPIFVQSLTDSRPTYQFSVGDSGQFGAFLDNKFNWVANSKTRGTVNVDYREKRGFAGGVDVQYFPSPNSDMLLKTYYAQDLLYRTVQPNSVSRGNPSDSNVYDGVSSENRYRIAYEQHLQFGPDFSSTAALNVWSDPWITRDFFTSEYQQANQPANFFSLDQYNPGFTVSLLVAPQVNPFFETVERLPEFSVESKQQKIFGSPVEYTSQSSVVNFQRKYADLHHFQNPGDYIYNSFPTPGTVPQNGLFPQGLPTQPLTAYSYYHPNAQYGYNTAEQNNYSAFRYDTYHEFALPHQYFNFLTLTPRIGGRLTYYSDDNSELNDFSYKKNPGGAVLSRNKITDPVARLAGDVGLSGDMKISRTWLDAKAPNLGINGIRHEVEPFFDAQFAPTPTETPNNIRGFDNRLYSTQLQPLDWTEYNSIDSIDRQAVLRFGAWNKIQTKRDGVNYDLVTLQTYMDADMYNNFSAATHNSVVSNLFNNLKITPTPQFTFNILTSTAIANGGYNQVDASATWSPDPSLSFTVGEHYINHSFFFQNSNNASLSVFYRMNEHWQFEAQEQFQAESGHLQLQQYTIFRDLDAWQLALTYATSQINGQQDQSIFFSLTLKAFPQYELHTPRL